jgi:alpha 1,2-mannosyltransferase
MYSLTSIRIVRLILILFFAIASLYYISRSYSRLPIPPSADSFTPGGKEPPKLPAQFPISQEPLPQDTELLRTSTGKLRQKGKTKAAFVTLIRNRELWDIISSIRQIEDRFNRNYHYPWVFLNDEPFTDEFIELTTKLVSGEVKFGM